ncbi:hypothetical protein PIB30_057092 [Stylosanthes scabra]|uniref:Uncharacterized protein n=1 Tax=Stylosanthes scabra TaxID=79078 RepID=A0ABU6UKD6_9FABA|nr:hypothetical protein [Stylosanthes scabra]
MTTDNTDRDSEDISELQMARSEPITNDFTPEQREALLALLSRHAVNHSHNISQILTKKAITPLQGAKWRERAQGKLRRIRKARRMDKEPKSPTCLDRAAAPFRWRARALLT